MTIRVFIAQIFFLTPALNQLEQRVPPKKQSTPYFESPCSNDQSVPSPNVVRLWALALVLLIGGEHGLGRISRAEILKRYFLGLFVTAVTKRPTFSQIFKKREFQS